MNSCVEKKPKLIEMKKTELIKGILKLAEELDKADGFAPVIIIDDMQRLVDKYVEQLFIPRVSNCADLERELKVTEQLLAERQRVLDAIPECKSHGKCVPHAIEWIKEMKAKHCC